MFCANLAVLHFRTRLNNLKLRESMDDGSIGEEERVEEEGHGRGGRDKGRE